MAHELLSKSEVKYCKKSYKYICVSKTRVHFKLRLSLKFINCKILSKTEEEFSPASAHPESLKAVTLPSRTLSLGHLPGCSQTVPASGRPMWDQAWGQRAAHFTLKEPGGHLSILSWGPGFLPHPSSFISFFN